MTEDTTADTHARQPGAVEEPSDPATTAGSEADDGDGLSTVEGWLVAGALALLLVGAPLVVYAWPPGFLGFRDAYLAVAMVPGFLLGLLGLWAAARAS